MPHCLDNGGLTKGDWRTYRKGIGGLTKGDGGSIVQWGGYGKRERKIEDLSFLYSPELKPLDTATGIICP
jgi:hypothetical protein